MFKEEPASDNDGGEDEEGQEPHTKKNQIGGKNPATQKALASALQIGRHIIIYSEVAAESYSYRPPGGDMFLCTGGPVRPRGSRVCSLSGMTPASREGVRRSLPLCSAGCLTRPNHVNVLGRKVPARER